MIWLQVFTIYLRYLVGGAFIIAAFMMGKVTNNPMPVAAVNEPIQNLLPIQQFFRVMIDSGLYWKFIGWTQILCGVLLMWQKWAKLGAIIFLGMMLNIFIITVAYNFTGTPIVTGLMLLAAIYLVLWDLQDIQYLVFSPDPAQVQQFQEPSFIRNNYWLWLGVVMSLSIVAMSLMRLHIFFQLGVPFFQGLGGFVVAIVRNKPNIRNKGV